MSSLHRARTPPLSSKGGEPLSHPPGARGRRPAAAALGHVSCRPPALLSGKARGMRRVRGPRLGPQAPAGLRAQGQPAALEPPQPPDRSAHCALPTPSGGHHRSDLMDAETEAQGSYGPGLRGSRAGVCIQGFIPSVCSFIMGRDGRTLGDPLKP